MDMLIADEVARGVKTRWKTKIKGHRGARVRGGRRLVEAREPVLAPHRGTTRTPKLGNVVSSSPPAAQCPVRAIGGGHAGALAGVTGLRVALMTAEVTDNLPEPRPATRNTEK